MSSQSRIATMASALVAALVGTVGAGMAFAHAAAARGGDPVVYKPGAEVRAAFAVGTPLVEVEDYKVHASRREAPGQAEVHEIDTDIIYVLDGGATLVTGGEVVDPGTVAPAEIRGREIRNGTPLRLSPGDFVVVPAGTPHWFEAVDGPFLYYVVKVPEGRMEGGDR